MDIADIVGVNIVDIVGVNIVDTVGVIGVLGVPLPLPTLGLGVPLPTLGLGVPLPTLGVPLTPLPFLVPIGIVRMDGVLSLSLCLDGVWESPLPPLHDFLLAGVSFGEPVRYQDIKNARYITVRYSTVHYSKLQYNTEKYSTVHYSTIQYSTIQYSTIQYSTIQYSSLQYNMDDNEVCIVWDLNPGLKT